MYIMLPIMLAVRIGNDEDRKYLEKLYNETYRALVSYADSILQCREDSLDQVQALFLEMTGHIKACLLYTYPIPRDTERSRMPY